MASYDDSRKEPSRPAHISDITNLIGYFKEHETETRYQDVPVVLNPRFLRIGHAVKGLSQALRLN